MSQGLVGVSDFLMNLKPMGPFSKILNPKADLQQGKIMFRMRLQWHLYFTVMLLQWSLYFKTTHGTKKMWSYIAGGLKKVVI